MHPEFGTLRRGSGLKGVLCLAICAVYFRGFPARADEGTLDSLLSLMGGDLKGLDWERETKDIEAAMSATWARNGWNDEADRFAFELERDVAAVPPWQVAERLDLLTRRLSDRYGLTEGQAARAKGVLLRELGSTLVKNNKVLLKQTKEFMELRLADKPFTAGMIAEWVNESRPMVEDLTKGVDRFFKELEPTIAADRRDVFQRDTESYDKRLHYFEEMAVRWGKGEWHPADWGLEKNPKYRDVVDAPGPRVVNSSRPPRAGMMVDPLRKAEMTRCVAHDPKTWFACVLEFRRRYRLDPGQFAAARSIHDELFLRAAEYSKTREGELSAIPKSDQETHELFEPIRSLFGEMRERLDAIPTTSQLADPAEP